MDLWDWCAANEWDLEYLLTIGYAYYLLHPLLRPLLCPPSVSPLVYLSYADSFVTAINTAASSPTFARQNGAFITSCMCHNCAWSLLNMPVSIGNTTALDAMTRWYHSSKEGEGHVYIDPRRSNGDGALLHTPSCSDWHLPS